MYYNKLFHKITIQNEETSGDSPKEGFSFNFSEDEGQNSSEEEGFKHLLVFNK